jgi:hypothetical protein
MAVTLGTASHPVLLHGLKALDRVLDKAIASAASRKIDERVFM